MITDVGKFLTDLGSNPKTEAIDQITIFTQDVRQDAATRAWLALTRRGLTVTDANFAALLNSHKDVAFGALKFSLINEIQKKRRRNEIKALMLAIAGVGRDLLTGDEVEKLELSVINEPHPESCLEDLQDSAMDAILLSYDLGNTDQREAICLMLYIQRCKELEHAWSTPYHRMRLARLRKRTGWPLNAKAL